MESSLLEREPSHSVALPAGDGGPLFKLRSDERLVALFRAGQEEAFSAIHRRYQERILAYVRQMLPSHARHEAEDITQDVFLRAYSGLRAHNRPLALKAWLYRIAHNCCIDHLRKKKHDTDNDLIESAPSSDSSDPLLASQQREELRQLIASVDSLPSQQRSALLMREMEGLSYPELADNLGVTVSAVKSLLVRARTGLVTEIASQNADCGEIRDELALAWDRGVRASSRAHRHIKACRPCREYRGELRVTRRRLGALLPTGTFKFGLLGKLLGFGASGGGATVGGTAATVGGGASVITGTKVLAIVCSTAVTAGGALEIHHLTEKREGREDRPELASVLADSQPAGLNGQLGTPIAAGQPTFPLFPAPDSKVVADTDPSRSDSDTVDTDGTVTRDEARTVEDSPDETTSQKSEKSLDRPRKSESGSHARESDDAATEKSAAGKIQPVSSEQQANLTNRDVARNGSVSKPIDDPPIGPTSSDPDATAESDKDLTNSESN